MPAAPREPASQLRGSGATAARRLFLSEERTAEGAGREAWHGRVRAPGPGRLCGGPGQALHGRVSCGVSDEGSRGCLWTTTGELGGPHRDEGGDGLERGVGASRGPPLTRGGRACKCIRARAGGVAPRMLRLDADAMESGGTGGGSKDLVSSCFQLKSGTQACGLGPELQKGVHFGGAASPESSACV